MFALVWFFATQVPQPINPPREVIVAPVIIYGTPPDCAFSPRKLVQGTGEVRGFCGSRG